MGYFLVPPRLLPFASSTAFCTAFCFSYTPKEVQAFADLLGGGKGDVIKGGEQGEGQGGGAMDDGAHWAGVTESKSGAAEAAEAAEGAVAGPSSSAATAAISTASTAASTFVPAASFGGSKLGCVHS